MIAMNDLRRQVAETRRPLLEAIERVLERGWFILGQEVEAFEQEFAAFLGVEGVVGVGNGLEALQLALMAWDIGAGDEVITTPNSAFATTLAILRVGATPVFVDLDPETYTLDVAQAAGAVTQRTRAVLPVHIYGQAADLEPLLALSREHALVLIADAAQAHGTTYRDRDVAAYGDAVAYSFYPTKNLGALGDAGAFVCRDPDRALRIRALRDYGRRPKDRDRCVEAGLNSRLDEFQAAVLRVRLCDLRRQNIRRRELAEIYRDGLRDLPVTPPPEKAYGAHVYHLFVIRTAKRDRLREFLGEHDIETTVHYPLIIPQQPAMARFGYSSGTLPVAERCAAEFLSLPISPELTDDQVREVCTIVRSFFRGRA
jgi:dTDP-4-amino-4,6-dideoxygalactose transaminase